MAVMKIDFKKLLGYRLVADQANEAVMSAKVGDKRGAISKAALATKLGEKAGDKVGVKDGKKPVR
ncbi:hypothetical protein [uncultured Shimia sp.]|uniref:hypothetical protein n=1 Tax=uncultured Shimia sp. TaxID=573152 RepID=UPI0026171B5E|nr:hypothetical protein [uncultured Shimia sp.]